MRFELFLPYIKGASIDMKDNLNGYYKTHQDYADALVTEDTMNGTTVHNIMAGGGFRSNNYYGFGHQYKEIDEKIAFAKAPCLLMTPDARFDETVDSMIDKFASQKEFLVTAHFNTEDMDAEFEEELRQWAKETLNILVAGREMVKKGASRADGDMFVEKNIPRRDMRLSFLNKSGSMVNFILRECEVEKKIAKNRYIFYVKRMDMLR